MKTHLEGFKPEHHQQAATHLNNERHLGLDAKALAELQAISRESLSAAALSQGHSLG